MATKKRTSRILDDADTRASGLQSINSTLELGPNLTLAAFKQLIADGRAKLDEYNRTLALADQKANELKAAEKAARDYSARMLAGIGAAFGKDSTQYEQSGGTRTSERRVAARKQASKSPA